MSEHPEYGEGVCGDGAAILKDGQMMRIEDVVSELKRISDLEARLEKAEAERENIEKQLQDPAAVRVNMLRGGIAKPDGLVWLHDTDGPVAEAVANARNDALTGAQDYLRRVPSFGDGKWAANHLEALKSPTPDQGGER